MPNLINVVGSAHSDSVGEAKYATEEERMMAVRAALQKGSEKGMEWGTCMVFSCASDCCEGDKQFAEETVLVQWEDLTS
jgi:pre-rRNA-processing protein TSR4